MSFKTWHSKHVYPLTHSVLVLRTCSPSSWPWYSSDDNSSVCKRALSTTPSSVSAHVFWADLGKPTCTVSSSISSPALVWICVCLAWHTPHPLKHWAIRKEVQIDVSGLPSLETGNPSTDFLSQLPWGMIRIFFYSLCTFNSFSKYFLTILFWRVYLFLVKPCSMRDLGSLTRDWTRAPCIGSMEP